MPSEPTYRCENHILSVTDGSLRVEINLSELPHYLDGDSQEDFADAICWDWILDAAVRRLTGGSTAWSGSDRRMSADVLARMEAFAGASIRFDVLAELNRLAKNLIAHEHIYWRLYHSGDFTDPHGGRRGGAEWLRRNGIESNYTTDLEGPKALMDLVQTRLDAAITDHAAAGYRVRVKPGVEGAGREGIALARVSGRGRQTWTVVQWDNAEDPETFKADCLERIR